MKLIVGGAYQGKLAYAKERYQVQDGWVDGRSCEMEAIMQCRGMHHFHEYVKRMICKREDMHLISLEDQAEQFVQMLKEKNPGILVVSNELGYGIVPLEKGDRMWRETVGRISTAIAKEADEVVRVVCGMGTRIK